MPETNVTTEWPSPGPRWIPYPNRFWRWRAVLNGWRDGHRGIGQTIEPAKRGAIPSDPPVPVPAPTGPTAGAMYTGEINTYETPPFISRFLQVGAWKVNLVGQQFAEGNKIYERSRQVEGERLHECAERIKRAEAALELVRNRRAEGRGARQGGSEPTAGGPRLRSSWRSRC